MPSDIERHRRSSQHLEKSITTVICDSPERKLLAAKAKMENQGKAIRNLNESAEPKSKRSRQTEEGKQITHQNVPAEMHDINQSTESIIDYDVDATESESHEIFSRKRDSAAKIHEQSSIAAYLGHHEEREISPNEMADDNTYEEPVAAAKHVTAKDIALEVVSLMKDMNFNDKDNELESSNRLLDTCEVAIDLTEWKRINNISELVNRVP